MAKKQKNQQPFTRESIIDKLKFMQKGKKPLEKIVQNHKELIKTNADQSHSESEPTLFKLVQKQVQEKTALLDQKPDEERI